MKSTVFLVLLICCLAQCRKVIVPLDKTANIAFINSEGGGGLRQGSTKPGAPSLIVPPNSPVNSAPAHNPNIGQGSKPVIQPNSPTANQQKPQQLPSKPVAPITPPITPNTPIQPNVPPKPVNAGHPPQQIKPGTPVTTPGPGSVKQLVNFYDSQGKASVIRPYSYSQAVKQG